MTLLGGIKEGTQLTDRICEFDAVEIGDQWAAHIRGSPTDARIKVLMVNTDLFDLKVVNDEAGKLWTCWQGSDKKPIALRQPPPWRRLRRSSTCRTTTTS
eukprot:15438891-Alexandrium_andersonii.AAC.1